jgi:dTDP-4-dehydrorhamnose reductase
MRLFITGSKGQLGSALAHQASRRHEGQNISGGDLPEFDITDADQTRAVIAAARPDIVIHCAAFTDVDGAARQPELAYRVNGLGTQNVALACAATGAAMLYISSNEVFDGTQRNPYREFDPTQPANPYGYSKLAGEWFTANLLTRFYIVRTSWLTAAGGRNFVHRIRQLADSADAPLRVVTDEVACPTFVSDLVPALLQLIETGSYGIYHFVNGGYCSRYDYARRILDLTGRGHVTIQPIALADFARPSVPPRFSPLANLNGASLGISLRPWEEALADFLRSQ